MTRLGGWGGIVVVAIGALAFGSDEAVRMWSDSTGKFRLQARFVGEEAGKVTLEKEDGSQVEIEMSKLSPTDQAVVAERKKAVAESPFKTKEASPFKTVSPAKALTPAASKAGAPGSGESGAARRVSVNWAGAEKISLAATNAEWKVIPPAPAMPLFAKNPKAVSLPPKSNFFEGLTGLAVNPVSGKAVVGYTFGEPKPLGQTRIVMCDLVSGKAGQPATASGQMVPIAVHDNGRHIVMRRNEFGFGNQDRLEIWTVNGTTVNRQLEWIPYEDTKGGQRDVMWAEFIDDSTLATSSRNGRVALWNITDMQPVCRLDLCDGAVPALSPDRKIIAWCDGEHIGLFDVVKREVIATEPTPRQLQWPFLAFSPTGKRLACIAFDRLLAWDVATGKLQSEIPAGNLHVHGSIEFPHDDYLLGGDHFLVDLPNQLKLWEYQGHQKVRSVGGWTFFALAEHQQNGALLPAQLPHPAALDLEKKTLSQPDLFVFRAGTTVRLDVSGIPDADQQNKVRLSLTKRLQQMGCKVGPQGTIDLVAYVTGPKEREISYIAAGSYKVQEYHTGLKFEYDGKTVWETGSTNVPHFLMLRGGESIETHLRNNEKPQYSFYDNVELPKFLQRPSENSGPAGGGTTLGRSQVTAAGIK